MKYLLLILLIPIAAYSKMNILAYEDTLYTTMPTDSISILKDRWLQRIQGYLSPLVSTPCKENCMYIIEPFYNIGVTINSNRLKNDTNQILMKYGYFKSQERIGKYLFGNITYTFKQELRLDTSIGKYPTYKSPLLFTGLTLLNSGLGIIYSSHNNPVFKTPSYFMDYLIVIIDAGLTAGLFVDNKGINNFSYVFLPIYKGLTLLRFNIISKNNKLVKSKYKFDY